jgi:transcriptional regulator of acetoin/glycerol metabolism
MPRGEPTPEEITDVLNECAGDIRLAAARLMMSERTLYRRMTLYGIRSRVRYELTDRRSA